MSVELKSKSAIQFPDVMKIKDEFTKKFGEDLAKILYGGLKNIYDDLVSLDATQNTDQYLDYGGASQSAVADVHDAISKKHTQNTDTHMGTIDANINFNGHQGLGFIIENRTDDTGCTQTGRTWFRTNV